MTVDSKPKRSIPAPPLGAPCAFCLHFEALDSPPREAGSFLNQAAKGWCNWAASVIPLPVLQEIEHAINRATDFDDPIDFRPVAIYQWPDTCPGRTAPGDDK